MPIRDADAPVVPAVPVVLAAAPAVVDGDLVVVPAPPAVVDVAAPDEVVLEVAPDVVVELVRDPLPIIAFASK